MIVPAQFPARMFRWAAIYGLIVLTPMYFAPLPPQLGETLLGFIGLALVFQGVFWVIGSDPVKYRALMPLAVAEKLAFGVPALALFGRVKGLACCFHGLFRHLRAKVMAGFPAFRLVPGRKVSTKTYTNGI